MTNILDDLSIKCLKCNQTHLKRRSFFTDHQERSCASVYTSDLTVEMPCNLTNSDEHYRNKRDQEQMMSETLQQENQRLKLQLNQHRTEIETFHEENQYLREQLNQRNAEIRISRDEIQRLKGKLDEQQNRLDELENMNERLNTRTSTQEAEIQDLQRENQNMRNQLDEQVIQIQTLQGENRDLKSRLEESMARIERQDDQITGLKIQSEQQQITIHQTQDRLQRLEIALQLQGQRQNRQTSAESRHTEIRTDSPLVPPAKLGQSLSLEEVDNAIDTLFKQFNTSREVIQTINAYRNHLVQENFPDIDENVEQAANQQSRNGNELALLIFSIVQIANEASQRANNFSKVLIYQNTQPIMTGNLPNTKIQPLRSNSVDTMPFTPAQHQERM